MLVNADQIQQSILEQSLRSFQQSNDLKKQKERMNQLVAKSKETFNKIKISHSNFGKI